MNTVIINSIGTATPGASKILSDALKVPQDYMLKLLYNAPSILFQKVDNHTALKAEDTLTKLGLDVSVCKEEDKVDLTTELVDISVSLDNVLQLPKVTEQLATFLGCKQSEVLNLLLNDPSIILGNVSVATAKALQKRVDANVHYSNPKKDVYTILISDTIEDAELKNIEKQLKRTASKVGEVYAVEDVSYDSSQLLWRKFHAKKTVKLVNQSHQLVHLIMNDFDVNNQKHISFLVNQVGMPEAILEDVQNAMPITLFESINRKNAEKIVESSVAMGMTVDVEKDVNFKKKLQIEAIEDFENVTNVLRQFIAKEDLPKEGAKNWESKEAIPPIIARYLLAQLEQLMCNPEII
ncbi:hypothetical protein [Tenacibaculum agarivorans]|uniref:hypothetical protein n=1 Tax=Tenacibaculum agarivorans TaxID=1908389 RepID=UPI00094BAC9C|nr:hypothetical protein [Tenacibaculum agarivorans]